MKLSISLQMPEETREEYSRCRTSIEDTVARALQLVDSGHESRVEWLMLSKLYTSLQKKKKTDRVTNLIKMIEPVLRKYGYYGVATNEQQ